MPLKFDDRDEPVAESDAVHFLGYPEGGPRPGVNIVVAVAAINELRATTPGNPLEVFRMNKGKIRAAASKKYDASEGDEQSNLVVVEAGDL